ncbi:MAG: TetR/AcrR family transcriptional regulator, partial [Polyangiaceae bacterium]|nr:TetR/AcrR family transcriptional regulator [Polyangiaceae bacterium]
MASDGWRQVTIQSLCREASLNKRYFYESFEDLDALASAVVDEISEGLVKTAFEVATAARAAGSTTEALAREVMRVVIEYLTDDARRARVLFTEVADSPRAIAHRRAVIHGLAHALSAYGHEH